MPYYVLDDSRGEPANLQRELDRAEGNGWKLVSVVPQHASYDVNGNSQGKVGPYYILHRDG